jgi:hypothetical protein
MERIEHLLQLFISEGAHLLQQHLLPVHHQRGNGVRSPGSRWIARRIVWRGMQQHRSQDVQEGRQEQTPACVGSVAARIPAVLPMVPHGACLRAKDDEDIRHRQVTMAGG